MKKLIMTLMTAGTLTAMSCGDGRTNESANDTDVGGDNTEVAEPADTTSMESDTTSMDQQQRDDQNMQRGASENSDTESRNQRDSIQ